MKTIEEILKKSAFNQHTDQFIVDLDDMNWIVENLKSESSIGMDWEQAGRYIHKMKSLYEKKGRGYMMYLVLSVSPLAERYDSGERTRELYEAIWKVD